MIGRADKLKKFLTNQTLEFKEHVLSKGYGISVEFSINLEGLVEKMQIIEDFNNEVLWEEIEGKQYKWIIEHCKVCKGYDDNAPLHCDLISYLL